MAGQRQRWLQSEQEGAKWRKTLRHAQHWHLHLHARATCQDAAQTCRAATGRQDERVRQVLWSGCAATLARQAPYRFFPRTARGMKRTRWLKCDLSEWPTTAENPDGTGEGQPLLKAPPATAGASYKRRGVREAAACSRSATRCWGASRDKGFAGERERGYRTEVNYKKQLEPLAAHLPPPRPLMQRHVSTLSKRCDQKYGREKHRRAAAR